MRGQLLEVGYSRSVSQVEALDWSCIWAMGTSMGRGAGSSGVGESVIGKFISARLN